MARTDDTPNMKGLKDIIRYVKPHILIGLTGGGPAFDQVRPAVEFCSRSGAHCVKVPNAATPEEAPGLLWQPDAEEVLLPLSCGSLGSPA